MIFKGILFDFIGTTVIEKDPLMITRCFANAFRDHGVEVSDEFIRSNRGKDKKEVIAAALHQLNFSPGLVDPILASLISHIESNLDNFYENKGAKEIFTWLNLQNILIGIGTGLPRDTYEKIFRHLKWDTIPFDYIGIAGETGRGRPYPDMILDMLTKCRLRNDELLKVGDTIADIQEGKSASVTTAAILSGTQDEKELIAQQPDFIIHTLTELKELITGTTRV